MAIALATEQLDASTPRPTLVAALRVLTARAKRMPRYSPKYPAIHAEINQLLDWIVGR